MHGFFQWYGWEVVVEVTNEYFRRHENNCIETADNKYFTVQLWFVLGIRNACGNFLIKLAGPNKCVRGIVDLWNSFSVSTVQRRTGDKKNTHLYY